MYSKYANYNSFKIPCILKQARDLEDCLDLGTESRHMGNITSNKKIGHFNVCLFVGCYCYLNCTFFLTDSLLLKKGE